MKNNINTIILAFIILTGCTSIYEDDYSPRMNVVEVIPVFVAGYHGYTHKTLNDYSNEKDILVCISDSRAVMKNKSGEKLEFTIFTSSGENEIFCLDGEDIIGFDYGGNTSHYHYFKRIFPVSSSNPNPDNSILEINSATDTIYFQYKTASIPSTTITDTLVKN